MTKSNLREVVCFSLQLQHIMKEDRNSGKELKQRHGEVLFTGLLLLTSQFVFLYTQDSLPEGSTTYNKLDQPTSITNQENAHGSI